MTAYFVARIKVKNPESLAQYSKSAAPILSKFGGKLLFKGDVGDIFLEDTELSTLAVFEFPHKDRKSTRLNSSHDQISYAVFCLKKKKKKQQAAQSDKR